MSARAITDELVEQVWKDLIERYGLDADDVRRLGARLSGASGGERRAENRAFAERFAGEHHETFERLAK